MPPIRDWREEIPPILIAGPGIAIEDHGAVKTISSSSAGLSGRSNVNFGVFPAAQFVTVTVLDAGVTATSVIQVSIQANPSFLDMDEVELSHPAVSFGNIVPGVSFDLIAYSMNDDLDGRYIIHYVRI